MNEIDRYKRRLAKAREKIRILEDMVESRTREVYLTNLGLREKNEKLEKLVAKNKELEEFAFVASHDLQEPLRTIMSFTDLLAMQYQGELGDDADQYLEFIQEASKRMSTLIKDLLDYSRLGNKRVLVSVDCLEMLSSIQKDMGLLIQETYTQIVIETALPIIGAYQTEMRILFQNLINNAIKFRYASRNPVVKIGVKEEENYWCFYVKDNGIGIAENHREKIFTIFQRLHPRSAYEGTGIGLAHCRKIVELHDGKIWVESILGEGSTFFFRILK